MDKLIITPGKVRGLGNLLTPKQVEDLILYQSDVSIASDGTFIMDYTQNNLIVTDYETIVINGDSTSVTVRVLDDNQSPIADVPVTLYDGTTSITNGTTNSSGYAVLNYTLTTDGSHMLHVEGNNLKSKRWEVLVKTISSISISRSTAEVWKGSQVTFSALVSDSSQNIIEGVPVHFIISDGVSQLQNVTINTDANGIATTSFSGQFFTNGNITCNATCGGLSDSTLVTEIYRYYVNGAVHNDLTLIEFIPQGELIDANGNLVLPKNQSQGSVVTFGETLPQKFNIAWEYKGSITNFNGLEFGIGNLNGYSFSWINGSLVSFTNNTFTVNSETFSGSLQTGDIFNLNYDGTSLEISQIRSNTVLWSKVVVVSIQNGNFGFKLGTYNGYKMNNVIATYYDRNPPVPSFDGITLSGDKSILSAADSEYVTLTAQLTDGGSAASVEGETVTFTIYKDSDDSVVDTLTADTNSSGVATVSYYGQGAGDLYIKAECIFVSGTYALQDCIYYDSQTVDKSRYSITSGSANVSYSNNGLTVKGTVNTDTRVENTVLQLPSEYVATLEITGKEGAGGSGTQYYGGFAFDDLLIDFKGTSKGVTFYNLSSLSSLGEITHTLQNNDVIKIERENGSMKTYINDVLEYTYSCSSTGKFLHRTYNNRSLTCKDLKIKPL